MEMYLIVGIGLVVLTFIDFFHTTLSSEGYGFLSRSINNGLTYLILGPKSRFLYKYSGLLHLLVNSFIWLVLLLAGSYLIFLSEPDMVVNSVTKVPASAIERFYYTCYVISTAGIGDYIPGNNLSRMLSGVVSFSGFIMLTMNITYLIAVLNAVNHKKNLATYISTMGEDVESLYTYLLQDGKLALESTSDLRTLILKHNVNHFSYPVIQRFLSNSNKLSAVVQLASLYEVLRVVKNRLDISSQQVKKIDALLAAIDDYLEIHKNEKFKDEKRLAELGQMRMIWLERYKEKIIQPQKMDSLVTSTLKSIGKEWTDVYTNSHS
ncbi:MAG: hypothetical protein CL868_13235 [Cytophagaceae bacterium]|nr:hypothetical protein [Cytophagaceae bacterium]|tara:strand:+ start:1589 stop:2554 length:966 start_codon:yes stop_codon:yes gene_type:complete